MTDIIVDIGGGLKKRYRDMGDGTVAEVVCVVSAGPPPIVSTYSVAAGNPTTGLMNLVVYKDANRIQSVIKNNTPVTLVMTEDTTDNRIENQPSAAGNVDIPPGKQGRVMGGASKIWVGGKPMAVSSVTSSGTTCTIVFPSAHNLPDGDFIALKDYLPTGYNGTYVIHVVDATTITVTLAASAGSVTTQGSVIPCPSQGITVETTFTP